MIHHVVFLVLILLKTTGCGQCSKPSDPSPRSSVRRVSEHTPIRISRQPPVPSNETTPVHPEPGPVDTTPVVVPSTPEVIHPCLRLVDEACRLFGHGSEECVETRARVAPGVPDSWRPRCANTIEQMERNELVPPQKSACAVLAEKRCQQVGDNTTSCKAIRKMLITTRIDEARLKGCLADVLLLEGLP